MYGLLNAILEGSVHAKAKLELGKLTDEEK